MAFQCDLGNGQSLYLDNQNDKTLITLASHSQGQQQQSSSSFITGLWKTPPQVYRVNNNIRIKINTAVQEYIFAVVNNGIALVTDDEANQAQSIPLQPAQDMPKMQPMQPLKMGDMSMSFKPMTMTMGNMSMSMEEKNPSP